MSDIKEIIGKANRSEIGRQTGLSLSGVSRILSGKRNATSANLAAIARYLGVTMDDLYKYLEYLKVRSRNRRRRGSGTAAA